MKQGIRRLWLAKLLKPSSLLGFSAQCDLFRFSNTLNKVYPSKEQGPQFIRLTVGGDRENSHQRLYIR